MKLTKSLFLTTSLALILGTNVYAQNQSAQPISANEKGSLATIAAIDKNEIIVSIIAENKQVDTNVIDFAKMMINQHGSNLTKIYEMEHQLKTGPLSGGESEKITQEGKQGLMKLSALQGKEFADAYADAMVTGHEGALKLINDKLLKTAKSEEIKNFLTATRAVVEQHLEHAKKLQEELKS